VAKTWARIASLIGTCRLNGINPEAYIAATLRKILDQHMQSDSAASGLTGTKESEFGFPCFAGCAIQGDAHRNRFHGLSV
jgi:hypothetical protein